MPSPSITDLQSAAGKVRRRIVPFLFVCYFIAYLDRINVGFAALQMNAALGFSAAVYGFGAGIFFVGYTAFEIPSNIILARVGARLWIARLMITWGLVSAGMMFVQGATSFYALRFLLGLAEAGFFPGIIFYLTAWVPARERARTLASFMTAIVTAGIIGGPVSGALLELDGLGGLAGWQWMFLVEGLPAVLLGIAVWFVLDDRPADARWLSAGERTALTEELAREPAEDPDRAHGIGAALSHPWLWVLSLVYFVVPLSLYAFGFFAPQMIQGAFGGGAFEVGVLTAIPYLAAAGTMVVVSRHSDRTGERRWHVALALGVSGAAFIASAQGQTLGASVLLLSIAMMGLASALAPFWTLATSFVSGAGAAAGIALINSIGNIGGFVGPYVLGSLREGSGGFASGLIFIGVCVIAGAAIVLTVPVRRQTTVPGA